MPIAQGAHIFHQHRTFTTAPIAMADRRDETTRIDVQQCLRFLVGIDLDILIRDALRFQSNPDPLHEWATEKQPLATDLGGLTSRTASRTKPVRRKLTRSIRQRVSSHCLSSVF